MSFDLASLRHALAGRARVVRVVVARVDGSAPREVGAAMLVWEDGQSGTIGGGALEFEAVARARAQLAGGEAVARDKVPLGPELGQCCGGSVLLLREIFTAKDLQALEKLTLFARAATGAPCGGEMPLGVRRLLAQARDSGARALPAYIDGWMVEPVAAPAAPLWIYGAGHVGRALVDVITPLRDFVITWIDTTPDRFPEAPDGVTILPASAPQRVVAQAPRHAHHLVLTYSHALDLEICHALLNHGFASTGLIGSNTKWARFQRRLAALGHSPASIARITCPIGDKNLGKQPQAIAIGVAARLLKTKTDQTNGETSHEQHARGANRAAQP